MQATLLGLSVAIILALVAALVGPHFVDWTQYRASFEARGDAPCRRSRCASAGAIDVRILPTPSLTLGRVEIGSAAQPQAKAREIYAELALGALMRGDCPRLGTAHRRPGSFARSRRRTAASTCRPSASASIPTSS